MLVLIAGAAAGVLLASWQLWAGLMLPAALLALAGALALRTARDTEAPQNKTA